MSKFGKKLKLLEIVILTNFWHPGWPESESAYRKAPEKCDQINISTKFRKNYVFDIFNGFSDNLVWKFEFGVKNCI